MRGYLFDTNHVCKMHEKHPALIAKLASLPSDAHLYTSVIVLAEIDWGHAVTLTSDQAKRDAYQRFVDSTFVPTALPISVTTRVEYVRILKQIWAKHPPPKGKRTERHLLDLGVDINDVWIAATACEHGLVLVTTDNMACIRDEMPTDLQPENWLIASVPIVSPRPSAQSPSASPPTDSSL